MATILKTPKGAKSFNSYYLAVVEKNKLLKKGIKAEIIDKKDWVQYPTTRDCKLRTVYTPEEQKMLTRLRPDFGLSLFAKKKKEDNGTTKTI